MSWNTKSRTEARGGSSHASGRGSKAIRESEQAYASRQRVVAGDMQTIRVLYHGSYAGVGWWAVPLLKEMEDGKGYHFDTMVMGRQVSGVAGTVGDTFAYKFQGVITRDGAVYATIGSVTRTLIARSAGMSGDGLTTGARMSHYDPAAGTQNLRYDGVADTTFLIQTHSWIQEILI